MLHNDSDFIKFVNATREVVSSTTKDDDLYTTLLHNISWIHGERYKRTNREPLRYSSVMFKSTIELESRQSYLNKAI